MKIPAKLIDDDSSDFDLSSIGDWLSRLLRYMYIPVPHYTPLCTEILLFSYPTSKARDLLFNALGSVDVGKEMTQTLREGGNDDTTLLYAVIKRGPLRIDLLTVFNQYVESVTKAPRPPASWNCRCIMCLKTRFIISLESLVWVGIVEIITKAAYEVNWNDLQTVVDATGHTNENAAVSYVRAFFSNVIIRRTHFG
eukprot:GHVO01068298.1.p1 GENE.GHVO01068298.1~~GHVO01068298.1.p1  ORF type:complete len:196 (+),score=29.63 GHVO01068298.1:471-1058(+)